MESCDDDTKHLDSNNLKYGLSKNEIIRGYNSFSFILQNSAIVTSEYLKAYVCKQRPETIKTDFSKSPLFTGNVKVGFIIAKKKIRKASFRNRIRRILKESYRLNKQSFGIYKLNLYIILTMTDKGYELFKKTPAIKSAFIGEEIKILFPKIKNQFKKL